MPSLLGRSQAAAAGAPVGRRVAAMTIAMIASARREPDTRDHRGNRPAPLPVMGGV
jgi:hypothetical protein